MQWRKLLSSLVVVVCLACSKTPPLQNISIEEYDASELIDAPILAQVADSFQIPHAIFYALAWQETRGGNYNSTFPRGPGILVNSKITCREIGRLQLSPCVNWAVLLKDPICTNANLLSADKIFAYRVNIHCAAEHLAGLHRTFPWLEVIRHYNGTGYKSYIYLTSVLSYIGRYGLKLTE